MAPSAADLAVVIPTRDRWEILARTLQALREQTVTGFAVVVVVDGTDQQVPHLPGVTVEVVPQGGPAAARNAGVAATRAALLLFLGDDMIPRRGLVERHLRAHEQHPEEASALLGNVRWHPESGEGRLLRWLDWSATQFDFSGVDRDSAGFGRFYSCNVSLKRSLFDAAGGFDPGFRYYYEDLDFGWRLHQAGMRLRWDPDAVTDHLHDYDLARLEGRFRGIASGERRMAAKHDWFRPYYLDRVVGALACPRVPAYWPAIADVTGRLGRPVGRRRANRWYYQRLGDPFLDVWEGEQGLQELQDYLGDSYDERRLHEHVHEVDREEHDAADEATFYRTSTAYLYDLTVFAASGTKTPYLADLRAAVGPGARLLDYGCGIGSDGLRLLRLGYQVDFADFDNPSTRYLRWRLQQRGQTGNVYDVDGEVPGGYDAVYCFDVIEHIDDPFGFLDRLESKAGIVAVNFLEPAEHDVHVHKPLPVRRLLQRVGQGEVLRYRRYHGRSHLVIYRPHRRRLLSAARSAAVLDSGRVRNRLQARR